MPRTLEQRVVSIVTHLDQAAAELGYLERESPRRMVTKLRKQVEGIQQIAGRDLAREFSLPSSHYASSELAEGDHVQLRNSSKKGVVVEVAPKLGKRVYKVKLDSGPTVERGAWDLISKKASERVASRFLNAGAGREIMNRIFDEKAFFKLYREVTKQDKQSAELLREVWQKLSKTLDISDNEYNAMQRVTQLINSQGRWDIGLQRNNIFKAANLLGINLPSGSF